MRRRARTPASPCATVSSPCVCRSLRCTCRTSSGENRSAAARCWRTSRSAWWRGSVRRAIGWDSRAWSAISDPAMIADPRRARQEALAAALVAGGLDGVLVASPAHIRYLTGFSRPAAALGGEALRQALPRVRVGMTELEIAGILEGALRRLGSEGHPFPTIVASGARTALPHARSSRRTLVAGEWLLLDFGAQVDGYCADITRTVVVGARATDAQRTLYELVHTAQRRAREGGGAGGTGPGGGGPARGGVAPPGVGGALRHSPGPR